MSTTTSVPRRRAKAIAGVLPSTSPVSTLPRIVADMPSYEGAAKPLPQSAKLSPVDHLREGLYFSRPGGGACFDDRTNAAAEAVLRVADIQRSIAEFAARGDETAELRQLLRRATNRDGRPTTERQGFPRPAAAYHREASRRSLLRTDWSADAAQLAVDWSRPEMRCEFFLGDRSLFSGSCLPLVRIDGRLAEPTSDWEEVCWESNVDCDYLELELALAGGARLQRQFVLTRRDGLLFAADAVLLSRPAAIECEFGLPLASGVQAQPAGETREAVLTAGRRRALVVPLGLPEWRSERRRGEFEIDGRAAILQSAQGAAAMFAPLVVAFDRGVAKKPLTWRRLTVGEDLQLAPADRACGYRLQLGNRHWLAYRSLTPRANRTVLGVNLQTNFLLARFTAAGEHEPLVEIDE